jgi:hypothetical protein
MAAGLATRLSGTLPDGIDLDPTSLQGSPAQILALEPQVRDVVVDAFSGAVSEVFLAGIPLALTAFVLMVLLPERPLRQTRHVDAESDDPVDR